jgi:hypothetical protein
VGGSDEALEAGPLLELALLAAGKEDCAKILGDVYGELEGLVEWPRPGTRPKTRRLLTLGFLDSDKGGCAGTLGDAELAHGEFEGPVDGSDEGLERNRTSRTLG